MDGQPAERARIRRVVASVGPPTLKRRGRRPYGVTFAGQRSFDRAAKLNQGQAKDPRFEVLITTTQLVAVLVQNTGRPGPSTVEPVTGWLLGASGKSVDLDPEVAADVWRALTFPPKQAKKRIEKLVSSNPGFVELARHEAAQESNGTSHTSSQADPARTPDQPDVAQPVSTTPQRTQWLTTAVRTCRQEVERRILERERKIRIDGTAESLIQRVETGGEKLGRQATVGALVAASVATAGTDVVWTLKDTADAVFGWEDESLTGILTRFTLMGGASAAAAIKARKVGTSEVPIRLSQIHHRPIVAPKPPASPK